VDLLLLEIYSKHGWFKKMMLRKGFHAFGLSPFLPYNAPLCCLKAGNWLY
jgi:hypothetical protein